MSDLDSTQISIDQSPEKNNLKSPFNTESYLKSNLNSLRWLIMTFACLTCIGDYYCYNLPGSLQSALMDKLSLSTSQFNVIYIVALIPNIFLPVLGGVLINRLGLRAAYKIFCALLVVGQAIMTLGAQRSNYYILLFGQVIYALGGDCVLVSMTAMISKWFMGRELSFALGMSLCIARLGNCFDSFLSPNIYVSTSQLYVPYLIGLGFCCVSLLSSLMVGRFDEKAEQIKISLNEQPLSPTVLLRDTKNFNLLYYLVIVTSGLLYVGFEGLTYNLNHFMIQRFGFDSVTAGSFIPIIYICPILVSATLGKFTDQYGRRTLLLFVACVIFFLAHIILAFLPDTDSEHTDYAMIWILFWIGIFFAVYTTVLLPCIALVAGEKHTATGYGLAFAVQNLLLVIMSLGLGSIHEGASTETLAYFWSEVVLAIVVLVCIFMTVWMSLEDKRCDGKLNKSTIQNIKDEELENGFAVEMTMTSFKV